MSQILEVVINHTKRFFRMKDTLKVILADLSLVKESDLVINLAPRWEWQNWSWNNVLVCWSEILPFTVSCCMTKHDTDWTLRFVWLNTDHKWGRNVNIFVTGVVSWFIVLLAKTRGLESLISQIIFLAMLMVAKNLDSSITLDSSPKFIPC